MRIEFYLDSCESFTNIGIAKALIDDKSLTPDDLYELSRYLEVYCKAKNGDKHDST